MDSFELIRIQIYNERYGCDGYGEDVSGLQVLLSKFLSVKVGSGHGRFLNNGVRRGQLHVDHVIIHHCPDLIVRHVAGMSIARARQQNAAGYLSV